MALLLNLGFCDGLKQSKIYLNSRIYYLRFGYNENFNNQFSRLPQNLKAVMYFLSPVELYGSCAILMNEFGPELPSEFLDGGDLVSTWSGDRRLHAEIPWNSLNGGKTIK